MSPNYEKVKTYYLDGRWSEDRVHKAVGKWITQEECDEILTPGDQTEDPE